MALKFLIRIETDPLRPGEEVTTKKTKSLDQMLRGLRGFFVNFVVSFSRAS